jgi:hypothetical protein
VKHRIRSEKELDMWIRLYTAGVNENKREERLVNTAHISMINVTYAIGEWVTTVSEGRRTPEAERAFSFRVDSENLMVAAKPGDPVWEVLEDIYKQAIKSPDGPYTPATTNS